VARGFDAVALYPFGGPPYLPFQQWAMRAEGLQPSPLGALIHPDYGLWHAYRGALGFGERLALSPVSPRPRPCDDCADKPCLSTCPVGAFDGRGYDVPACAAHLDGPAGAACLSGRRRLPLRRSAGELPRRGLRRGAQGGGGMSGRIVLVRHMPGDRDDRVRRELCAAGYDLETCFVAEGDPLPEPAPGYVGAVVYGGSQFASQAEEVDYLRRELDWIRRWVGAGKSYLGICLGGQMLAKAFGAAVGPHGGGLSEIGYFEVEPTSAGRGHFAGPLGVYHWHIEGFEVPEGAELLATGADFPNQAFRFDGKVYGLQFHPEVTREMMESWCTEAAHMLELPGAHSRERQLADAERYHAALGDWLRQFLGDWLAD
jgi:GMP synthase (glutamine-hydrolysing)